VPGQPLKVGLAGQPDHGRAGPPGQLDRERADSARGSGNHHRVALGQVHCPNRRVGGRPGHEQSPGYLPGHTSGLGRQVLFFLSREDFIPPDPPDTDHDVLGLAGPVVSPADDLVAGREVSHSRTDLGYDPGQVAALPGRERGGPPGVQQSRADLGLAGIDPRRLDLDQDLPRPRHRARHVHHLQDLDPAVLIEPDRLH